MRYSQLLRRLAGPVLRDPRLVPLLFATAWRFRARDWYRRAPFLPLPTREYIDWRLHTAYGDDGPAPDSAELERYLRWAARIRKRERT